RPESPGRGRRARSARPRSAASWAAGIASILPSSFLLPPIPRDVRGVHELAEETLEQDGRLRERDRVSRLEQRRITADLQQDVPVTEEARGDDGGGGVLGEVQARVDVERHVRAIVVAERDRSHLAYLDPRDHHGRARLQATELVEVGGEQESTR